MASSLLFEIGVEEIPARFIPSGICQLEENFRKISSQHRIDIEEIKIYATPRRLTLKARVSSEQTAEERLIWGPPAYTAFDENGKPKKPVYAFAKAQGVDVKELQIRQKGKGNYICVVLYEKGKKTEEVLPEILIRLFFSINFPKMMRWADASIRFVRPVRWILALYNDQVVSLEIDGIKAGNITFGHSFLSEGPIVIKKIQDYESLLEKAFVVVDQNKRQNMIVTETTELAKKVDGKILWDEQLLQEVNYLVEFPNSVICNFPEDYLNLPEELLITVMKDHQRCFAISDSAGKLKNYFVVVSNTLSENEENIRKGAEKVIKARFEDARFYYEEDLKKGLDSLVEATKGIVYHKELGSLYDKSLRIMKIAEKLTQILFPEKVETIKVASKYCKADLASGVVKEFPELQGIMGGYYAKAEGLSDEVALTIKEHYLPKGFTDEGCILSIADKLDHIASFFFLGQAPSGTEDPFGLRKAANVVVSIVLKRKYPLSIKEMVEIIDIDEETKTKVLLFIAQRVESYFEASGFEINMIKTVSDFILNRPVCEIESRLQAIKLFQTEPDFESFFLAVKRVSNIIKGYEKMKLHEELFSQQEEKELYRVMRCSEEKVMEHLNSAQFFESLNLLNQLTPVVNKFFDRVLVMDQNEKTKMNRLALLQRVSVLLKSVADFSKLYI